MTNLPGYLWLITIVGVVGILAMTCATLYRGAQAAGLGKQKAALLATCAAAALGAWTATSSVIAAHGWYGTQLGKQPPWLLIAAVAELITLLAAARIPMVGRALAGPGAVSRMAWPHVFRVAGAAFLITMGLGHLPALFAMPAGFGDIATGIAEPFVARRLARGRGHRAALWFNLFGMLDLLVAMILGGLTGYRLIDVTPVNDTISILPLVLIPTTAVPVLIALHVLSIRRLRATTQARTTETASPDLASQPMVHPATP